jgi:hypothetical protein
LDEKRNIDGYEELFSFKLAGRVVILAEKVGADEPFLVCCGRSDNPLGIETYYNAAVTSDYIEAVRNFISEETILVDALALARDLSSLPFQTLTIADCIPYSMNENINGKLIVIKADALAPEYRSAQHQLAICCGGFGANPNAIGTAVFVKGLLDDKTSRFERYDIAGVVNPAHLPEWAKAKLNTMELANLNGQESIGINKNSDSPKTADTKHENLELKNEPASIMSNEACAASIDEAIRASYLGEYRYDLNAAVKSVVDEYGTQRVSAVLAAYLADTDFDGRFSGANKAWAKSHGEFPREDAQPRFVINTHRAVLDGFITKFRKSFEHQNKKPSLHDKMEAAKQEATTHNKSRLKDQPNKTNEMEK